MSPKSALTNFKIIQSTFSYAFRILCLSRLQVIGNYYLGINPFPYSNSSHIILLLDLQYGEYK